MAKEYLKAAKKQERGGMGLPPNQQNLADEDSNG